MPRNVSKGEMRADYAEPVDASEVHLLWQLPIDARVTSVVVRYVLVPNEVAMAELKAKIEKRKRHDAAVKAKAAEEVQP